MSGSCRICGGAPGQAYTVAEMMFGTGERFDYFQCSGCGCLQIADIPAARGPQYPEQYYSLAGSLKKPRLLRRLAAACAYGWPGLLGDAFFTGRSQEDLRRFRKLRVARTARILDVGSGRGHRVYALRQLGFANALGVDPFLAEDSSADGRLLARRASLADLDGTWDVVMLHHVLEHIPDQDATMTALGRILGAGGRIIVRIPTVSSEAWETYREAWVQLDAPRHLYLHSRESFRLLVERHGFALGSVEDDSTGFQYWGSELYRRGLALVVTGVSGTERQRQQFSRAERARFEARARRANAASRGDQFAAVLMRAG